MRAWSRSFIIALAAVLATGVAAPPAKAAESLVRVAQANDPELSGDGRFLVYSVFPGPDKVGGVFLRDNTTGRVERVDVSSRGTAGGCCSQRPSVSADGRFVAFRSVANNLVAGDTNGVADMFVRDRHTARTVRVSVSSAGVQADGPSTGPPRISADGRYVAFAAETRNLVPGKPTTFPVTQVYVHDLLTRHTERVSSDNAGAAGNRMSTEPAISADGRFVAFLSRASNFFAGDGDNSEDVFVRDRYAATTTHVNVPFNGAPGGDRSWAPAISADGRYVAFTSFSANMVPGDTNQTGDVFVRDLHEGTTERVSVSSSGAESQSYGTFQPPLITGDGRYVIFDLLSVPPVAADPTGAQEKFVRDRWTGTTERLRMPHDGNSGNSHAFGIRVSDDLRTVAFASYASSLEPASVKAAPARHAGPASHTLFVYSF